MQRQRELPDRAVALRLIGAILEEQGDDWLAVRRVSFAPAGKTLDGPISSVHRIP